ncbi:unnamed protein product [Gadus morhua 'NCC']
MDRLTTASQCGRMDRLTTASQCGRMDRLSFDPSPEISSFHEKPLIAALCVGKPSICSIARLLPIPSDTTAASLQWSTVVAPQAHSEHSTPPPHHVSRAGGAGAAQGSSERG